jgi:hypothetical protein
MDKFRQASNVNQWVFLWWQLAKGTFAPYVVDNLVASATADTVSVLCAAIEAQKHAMICINDPDVAVDFESLAPILRRAFETILPNRSQFEKEL